MMPRVYNRDVKDSFGKETAVAKRLLRFLSLLFVVLPVMLSAQSGAAPTAAIDITDEQVKAVNSTPGVDRQLKIVDMGKYNLAVGIVHRGPTGATRGAGAAAGGGAGRGGAGRGDGATGRGGAAAATPVRCGATPSGSTPSGVSGIAHDATAETYIIVSGAGTLVTGGTIVNGTRSGPESAVTTILNGPSCSGAMEGADLVRRVVKPGDIIIIPTGVPHGWTEITDHVDYLSVRPDPEKVLKAGYVHPALKK